MRALVVMGKILNLLKMREYDVKEISESLKVPEPEIREILQAMVGIELVEINGSVRLTSFGKAIADMKLKK